MDTTRRYKFHPIGGPAGYRSGAGSLVEYVAAGEAPTRDMPAVRFPDGTVRRVAWRDLLGVS